jgi:hypothetical protein
VLRAPPPVNYHRRIFPAEIKGMTTQEVPIKQNYPPDFLADVLYIANIFMI